MSTPGPICSASGLPECAITGSESEAHSVTLAGLGRRLIAKRRIDVPPGCGLRLRQSPLSLDGLVQPLRVAGISAPSAVPRTAAGAEGDRVSA